MSGSDIDPDEELTYIISQQPANGSVIVNGSIATYTPDPDFNGVDIFKFSVSDGELSATESIDVTINPVNDVKE